MKKNKKKIFFSLMLTIAMLFSVLTYSLAAGQTTNLQIVLGSGGKFSVNNSEAKDTTKTYPGVKVKIWKIGEVSTETEDKKDTSTDASSSKVSKDKKESTSPYDGKKEEDLDKEFGKPLEAVTGEDGSAYFYNVEYGKYYLRAEDYKGNPEKKESSIKFSTYIFNVKGDTDVEYVKPYQPTHSGGGGGGGGGFPPGHSDNKGGMKFLKVDSNTKIGLPGAKFTISKLVNGNYEIVKRDGKDLILESGSDGSFSVDGLDYGTYYLTETVSPKNKDHVYGLLASPFKFEIKENSIDSAPITILNKPNFDVPTTIKPENPEKDKPEKDKPEKDKPEKENRISIPRTGDVQIYYYSILGAVIFFIGLFISKKDSHRNTGAVS